MCNSPIFHFHVYQRSVVTRGYVFSAVLSNLYQKTTMVDLRYHEKYIIKICHGN